MRIFTDRALIYYTIAAVAAAASTTTPSSPNAAAAGTGKLACPPKPCIYLF